MKYPFNYVIGIIFLAKVFLRIGFNTRNVIPSIPKNIKSHNTFSDLGCAFKFFFPIRKLEN